MAENNSGSNQGGSQSGNQGGPKQGGLSWSSPASKPAAAPPVSFTTAPKTFTPSTAKSTSADGQMAQKGIPVQKTGVGKLVGIFAGGIIVGFLLGWGWSATRPSAVVNTASNTPATTDTQTDTQNPAASNGTVGSGIGISNTGAVTSSNAALTVPATQNAGNSVVVSSAVVSKPTWVLVYDSVGGKPSGKSLGAMVFFPTTKSGTIELLRPTISGHTYIVVQNVDDGDFAFSTAKDLSVRDAQGNLVSATFTTR